MENTVLKGKSRSKVGTRASYTVRREGWVPGNLYGHGEANVHFQVREEDIKQAIKDGHHMVTLELDGKEDQGLLKEIQFDTYGDKIVHVDFARISLDEVVETSVPVHTHGIPKGLSAGGILDVLHHEIPLRGKAKDLPEHIDLEIGELLLGESIRINELTLPAGVEALLGPEDPVVIVHQPRGQDEDAAEGEAPSEPEVIGKKDEKPESGGK